MRKGGKFLNCGAASVGVILQDNLVLALCQNESNEGLIFETSASESLYGSQFTLSTQLIKPNYLDCKEFGTPK